MFLKSSSPFFTATDAVRQFRTTEANLGFSANSNSPTFTFTNSTGDVTGTTIVVDTISAGSSFYTEITSNNFFSDVVNTTLAVGSTATFTIGNFVTLNATTLNLTTPLSIASGGIGLNVIGANGHVLGVVGGAAAWVPPTSVVIDWTSPGVLGDTTPTLGYFTDLHANVFKAISDSGSSTLLHVGANNGDGYAISNSLVGDSILTGDTRLLFKDTRDTYGPADMILQSGHLTVLRDVHSRVLESVVATGTPPLTVQSSTMVNNLNSRYLQGSDWAAPGAIGTTTPAQGIFTNYDNSLSIQNAHLFGTADNHFVFDTPPTKLFIFREDTVTGDITGYNDLVHLGAAQFETFVPIKTPSVTINELPFHFSEGLWTPSLATIRPGSGAIPNTTIEYQKRVGFYSRVGSHVSISYDLECTVLHGWDDVKPDFWFGIGDLPFEYSMPSISSLFATSEPITASYPNGYLGPVPTPLLPVFSGGDVMTLYEKNTIVPLSTWYLVPIPFGNWTADGKTLILSANFSGFVPDVATVPPINLAASGTGLIWNFWVSRGTAHSIRFKGSMQYYTPP